MLGGAAGGAGGMDGAAAGDVGGMIGTAAGGVGGIAATVRRDCSAIVAANVLSTPRLLRHSPFSLRVAGVE
jgi:hypothetical protein